MPRIDSSMVNPSPGMPAIRAKHEGLETAGAAGDLAVLGALLLGQQRYPEAEAVLEQSLAVWQSRYGNQHYEVAVVKHNLAALYAARGEHPRAVCTLIQLHDIKTRILGSTHPDVIALRDYIAAVSAQSATP